MTGAVGHGCTPTPVLLGPVSRPLFREELGDDFNVDGCCAILEVKPGDAGAFPLPVLRPSEPTRPRDPPTGWLMPEGPEIGE